MDIVYLIEDSSTGLKYLGSKKNWAGPDTYWGSPSCKCKRFKKYKLQQLWKEHFLNHKETFSFKILERYDKVDHNFLIGRELYNQYKYNVLKDEKFINAGLAKNGYCGNIFEGLSHEEIKALKNKISKGIRRNLDLMSDKEKQEKWGKCGKENGMYRKKHTVESKKAMSIKQKENGKIYSARTKGKSLNELYGEERATFIKNEISKYAKTRIGEKNSFYGRHHTKESKKKMSISAKGRKPVNTKKVYIEGEVYEGLNDAYNATNIKPTTIWHRIHSKNLKYKNYYYIV